MSILLEIPGISYEISKPILNDETKAKSDIRCWVF